MLKSWFEYFFLLTYFQNFPSTDVPLRFAPTGVLPRTYPQVKKKWGKKLYIRVQYIRVWVFLKKSFWNFRLPTSFWCFCPGKFSTEPSDIFWKNMLNTVLAWFTNISSFSYNFLKITKNSSISRFLKWIYRPIGE